MSNSNTPSTIQSIVDSATATVQSAVGAITGNPADKQHAANKQTHADAEHDLSKAGAHVGPLNVSTSGVTTENHDRTAGKADQTIGSGKEFIGNLVGNKSLAQEGKQQNIEGQGREAGGQVKDLVGGAVDRVTGVVGAGFAAVTGNQGAKAEFQAQHDKGKTNVRGVEADFK